jgi:hypothetical protein
MKIIFPMGAIAFGEVARGHQDGVIQHVGNLGRGANRGDRGIDGKPVDHRPLRSQRAAGDGRAVVGAAVAPDLVQGCGELLADSGEVRRAADGAAIRVNRDFVELAEGAFQSGQGLLHLLYAHVGHAKVDDHGSRKGKRIAGKEFERLLLPVFEDHEIIGLKPIYHAAVVVFYRYRNQN